jgi:hypothetical protein
VAYVRCFGENRALVGEKLAVTRDRQKWHEAVENEILDQLPRGSTSVNRIVAAMLRRGSTSPPGPVQQYAEISPQIPLIPGFLKTGE